MSDRKQSARITAIHAATAGGPATVEVSLLPGPPPAQLRYPVWYTPQLGDLVLIDWLGSQPYVSVAFF